MDHAGRCRPGAVGNPSRERDDTGALSTADGDAWGAPPGKRQGQKDRLRYALLLRRAGQSRVQEGVPVKISTGALLRNSVALPIALAVAAVFSSGLAAGDVT